MGTFADADMGEDRRVKALSGLKGYSGAPLFGGGTSLMGEGSQEDLTDRHGSVTENRCEHIEGL